MKIFIEDYNLKKLSTKMHLLDKYCAIKKEISEVFSCEGIFIIDDSSFYKVVCVKDDYLIKESMFSLGCNKLLIDRSIINKEFAYQLPIDFIIEKKTIFHYCLNSISKDMITFVVKGVFHNVIDNCETDIFTPTDFYFETEDKNKIDDIFIKEELNVFLSILN